MSKPVSEIKIGILGGGQLGRMLVQAGKEWNLDFYILDESASFPSGNVGAGFVTGNFKDYDDVYKFGKDKDIITVEIEHVNTDALLQLQREGVEVHPNPASLNIIKDKGTQKLFYKNHDLPTADFQIFESKKDIFLALESSTLAYPFVQKSRLAGYDGKGVAIIRNDNDVLEIMDVPSVTEKLVDISTEISVIASRNKNGQIRCYPAVDMEFHNKANLVEFVYFPSKISKEKQKEAENLAATIINELDICGLLAVEMFLDKDGKILINEIAPRPHNSGHITIEASITSQFQQHLRGICNLPLGDTRFHSPAVMVNLLGAKGHSGKTKYSGMDECLQIDGASIHLYGKATTKPYRKMGHATVLDKTRAKATRNAKQIKKFLKIHT
ncbi:MAG TPA: 5-(carboxyamino)imidazole ribonucleotide synthase [Saprospiraceae bacterium]|nr:5-(carboxyamino)imidazole ribonucleotide synthase [Saprospiraceae bacterium]MCC6689878.1 5-(carboxyamino)imidazole ribonucleotide synthase [Saprospiraceae bacterium]HMV24960.1 5-(carboxyamino)imidazole ribonucleotide synthase [Saprospiraceae bacterium]HMX82465.1 5-(carboxyamino)imidazole ribonucleotide synthase [Saprospiraceae bacterium]HMX85493.1 5-(carboxyamino)imidazole ribonucleotide synthase [Saprospiraceae bacterium]